MSLEFKTEHCKKTLFPNQCMSYIQLQLNILIGFFRHLADDSKVYQEE